MFSRMNQVVVEGIVGYAEYCEPELAYGFKPKNILYHNFALLLYSSSTAPNVETAADDITMTGTTMPFSPPTTRLRQ